MGQTKVAEFYYRKSLEEYNGTTDELPFYSQTAFNLSNLLYDKNDYEGALKVLLPVIAKMNEHEGNLFIPSVELPKLYLSMGRNLVALGRYEEGEQHYQEAIEAYKRDKSRYDIEIGGTDFTNDTAFYALKHNISLFASISYLDQGLYDQASSWLEESKENLRYLQEHFDTTRYNIPQRLLRQQLTEARLLVHQGKTEEAERIFRQFYTPDSKVGGKTKLECGQYLLDTRQWQEAIELYQQLDTNTVDAHKTTLDSIKGRTLFLYTDGVPEATDSENRMFGTERMLGALNREWEAAPETILNNVTKAVNRFVNDAEQFDDLTMLCLEYKGPQQTA